MAGRVVLRVQFIVHLDPFLGLLVNHGSVCVFRGSSFDVLAAFQGNAE